MDEKEQKELESQPEEQLKVQKEDEAEARAEGQSEVPTENIPEEKPEEKPEERPKEKPEEQQPYKKPELPGGSPQHDKLGKAVLFGLSAMLLVCVVALVVVVAGKSKDGSPFNGKNPEEWQASGNFMPTVSPKGEKDSDKQNVTPTKAASGLLPTSTPKAGKEENTPTLEPTPTLGLAAGAEVTSKPTPTPLPVHTKDPSVREPEVVPGQYTNMTLTKVPRAEVEEKIQEILEENADYVQTFAPAAEGDIVNINYIGTMDGIAFEGGTDNSEDGTDLYLGTGQFIDGFEEGLVGARAGDTVMLNLNFPDPYYNNLELSGKPVVFTVKVNSVTQVLVPEFNDEFAWKLGYRNTDEMMQKVWDELDADAFREQIDETLLATSEVEFCPQDKLEEERDYFINFYMSYAEYYAYYFDVDTEEALGFLGIGSREELEELAAEYAENIVKKELIFKKIAELSHIEISEEMFLERASEYAFDYGYESVEEFLDEYSEEVVRYAVLMEKVYEYIIDSAVIYNAG